MHMFDSLMYADVDEEGFDRLFEEVFWVTLSAPSAKLAKRNFKRFYTKVKMEKFHWNWRYIVKSSQKRIEDSRQQWRRKRSKLNFKILYNRFGLSKSSKLFYYKIEKNDKFKYLQNNTIWTSMHHESLSWFRKTVMKNSFIVEMNYHSHSM